MRTVYTREEWEILEKRGKTDISPRGNKMVIDNEGSWHDVIVVGDPIVVKNPFKYQRSIDLHYKVFGHLPCECGGDGLSCPFKTNNFKKGVK